MAYFLKSGSSYRVTSKEALDLHELLPAGTYSVLQDPFGNFYLDAIDSFVIPSKLYGTTTRHTDRIIKTFNDRPKSTGVLLNGEKGSGKTLLAMNISVEAAKLGVPTIVINRGWTDESFFKLLQDIEQPCILLFDEFEKVYEDHDQEKILTLLDGVYGSKKLYLFTVNDKWKVNQHMRNRPGRIFYLLDFAGLEMEFIREYCKDNLDKKNQKYTENVCNLSALFSQFNFDMLKALVEEMNRYGEDPATVLQILNAKPELDSGANYKMKIEHKGKVIDNECVHGDTFRGNPITQSGIRVNFLTNPKTDRWTDIMFKQENIKSFDAKAGEYVFEQNGSKLTLTRIRENPAYAYSDLF